VADAAFMAMMPMSFGKQDKKRDLSASFAKTKRVQIQLEGVAGESQESTSAKPATAKVVARPVNEEDDGESSDDMIGPMPAEAEDFEDENEEEEDEDDEFPISHEVVLKDHNKVCRELDEVINNRRCQH
jgi:hypothetical protein